MILRHVHDLTTADNVRPLEDGKLWNVHEVRPVEGTAYVEVHLRRVVGDELVLCLRPDDLILMAI